MPRQIRSRHPQPPTDKLPSNFGYQGHNMSVLNIQDRAWEYEERVGTMPAEVGPWPRSRFRER